MPVTAMELRVREIVGDSRLPISRKLMELRKLQSETRGIQRAERWSTFDYGLQDDLRVVEKALQQLGADAEDRGAAAL